MISQIGRHGYMVSGIEPAAFDKNTLARSKINAGHIKPGSPSMAVAVGKEQEKPFHLHAGASFKQGLQTARTEVG